MFIARNFISAFAATAIASSAAVALSPTAAADPPAPPAPIPAQQIPGLPALSELSPIIQQAAGNPEQATQLLMAAAQAFSHNPSAPEQSKSVAESVNQFVQSPPEAASTAHVVPPGVEPGAQAHLPTGIDPVHAAGPAPEAAPVSASTPANAVPVAATPPAPTGPAAAAAPGPAPAPPANGAAPAAAAPGYSPDSPPTQDFIYPSISNNCGTDGGNVLAPALSVAGPAKIPAPGPKAGQTAYVFTAVGTSGPADVQKLPLNVTWVNLTTGQSGSATLKPQADINPQGPTTLVATVDTGSGSIMSTIFGQVTTKDKQCQFMPTIGSTVVP
jgi:hypothetical protein